MVPVPGVNPGAPYSTCQDVAPPVVHAKDMSVVDTVVAVSNEGSGQVGASSILISSMAISQNCGLLPLDFVEVNLICMVLFA